jgi:hypothetical protein
VPRRRSTEARGGVAVTVSPKPVVSLETFNEPAYLVDFAAVTPGGPRPLLRVPVRTVFEGRRDLERAVETLRLAYRAALARDMFGLGGWGAVELVAVARAGIVRHGWATLHRRSGSYATPFVDDWGCYAAYGRRDERPPDDEIIERLRRPVPFEGGTPILASKSVSAHMEEDVFTSHTGKGDGLEHWFSPLANIGSFLNPFMHHTRGIKDLIDTLYEDAGADCIKELRIHSHGNRDLIRMGSDDIQSSDFDATGAIKPGKDQENLRKLIDTLKKLMCKPSKIIFDACNAAQGDLLKNISKNLGGNITVNGFSGIGNPVSEGDTNYRNGAKV